MADVQNATTAGVRGGCAASLSQQLHNGHTPATGLLEALAGYPLRLDVIRSGTRPLTRHEQGLLWADPGDCRWRSALLHGRGLIVAAAVYLLWLPARLPGQAAAELEEAAEPAGRILDRYGMRRIHQRSALDGSVDEMTGLQLAVRSEAVIDVDGRLAAVAQERITREFIDSVTLVPRSRRPHSRS